MKNLIVKLLKERKEITSYQIQTITRTSHEVYFVHELLETIRTNVETNYTVLIHVDKKDSIGDITFELSSCLEEEDIRHEIEKAISLCSVINNAKYNLPMEDVSSVEIKSNISEFEPSDLANSISSCFFKRREDENATINALEIFITKRKINIINSNGLDRSETTSNIFIESIPTYTLNGESVEIYSSYRFNVIDFEKLDEEVVTSLKDVKSRFFAKHPDYKIDTKIIFRPLEINEIIDTLVRDLSFGSLYNHLNQLNVGDDLQKGLKGSRLSVTMTNGQKGTVLKYIDRFGSLLKPKKIIDDGKVVGLYGDIKYAQYLKEDATGLLPFKKVEAGVISKENIIKEPYFECASMSGIQVILQSDYIGGEVRLGYYYDGEKTISVSGVTISGKLSEVLASLVLSKETIAIDDYEGPEIAAVKNMQIL